jgi:steroid delta-isomerase-like uncharacterized protein
MTNEQFVREWFDQVWNQQREDVIDRMMAPDAVIHDLTPAGPMKGPVDFKPFYRRFVQAFPDMRIEVLRTITEGDLTAVHCRVSATHSGDALGTPATHRKASISGMAIARIRNDQLVEGWNCFDFLSLYQQLGLVPALA